MYIFKSWSLFSNFWVFTKNNYIHSVFYSRKRRKFNFINNPSFNLKAGIDSSLSIKVISNYTQWSVGESNPVFSEQLAKLFGHACTTPPLLCGEYRIRIDNSCQPDKCFSQLKLIPLEPDPGTNRESSGI
jgi:hypothetical protein